MRWATKFRVFPRNNSRTQQWMKLIKILQFNWQFFLSVMSHLPLQKEISSIWKTFRILKNAHCRLIFLHNIFHDWTSLFLRNLCKSWEHPICPNELFERLHCHFIRHILPHNWKEANRGITLKMTSWLLH